jgi:hypothetical protein
MSGEDVKTKIRADGLRYKSKTPGSEFGSAFGVTMSCYRCGKHMPRARLVAFNVAGTRQWRCKDGC